MLKKALMISMLAIILALAAVCDEIAAEGTTISFWSTEGQPDRAAATQEIIDRFTAETGIEVKLVLIEENDIDSVMAANLAAGTMPDVVFHPVDFAAGWYVDGVLDADAATEVINALDASTFASGALNLVKTDTGAYAGVPSDAWVGLLIYRQDIFDELGLEAPTDFDKMLGAGKALSEAGYTGFVSGSDPGQVFTQQTFEHFALANGCQLVNDAGEVTLNTPECVEALQTYTDLIINYGTNDTSSYWATTRADYFSGNAAMTMWNPFLFDEMAGLRDAALPNCEQCTDDPAYIAKNSAFVGPFSGPRGGPAQYGVVNYMSITKNADTEAAKQFVEFWLSDGYLDWLAVAAEGKWPVRKGTSDDPTLYIAGHSQLPVGVDRKAPLSDFYSEEALAEIAQGIDNIDRWGFAQGQGVLVGALYSELTVPQAIADIIDGFLTPEEAAQRLQEQVEEIQATLAEE